MLKVVDFVAILNEENLFAKVCKENEGKTHMELDPDRCKNTIFVLVQN